MLSVRRSCNPIIFLVGLVAGLSLSACVSIGKSSFGAEMPKDGFDRLAPVSSPDVPTLDSSSEDPAPSRSPSDNEALVRALVLRSIGFTTVFLRRSFTREIGDDIAHGAKFDSVQAVNSFVELVPRFLAGAGQLRNVDFNTRTGVLKTFGVQGVLRRCEIVSLEVAGDEIIVHSIRWMNGKSEQDGFAQVCTPAHYITIEKTAKKFNFPTAIAVPAESMPRDIAWPQETR